MACIARRGKALVLRGTLTTFRRRCGKPNCRCAAGEPHESPALVVTQGTRSKTITLRADDVAEVAAALQRYADELRALDAAADEGLASLRARLAARRGSRR